MGTSRIIGRSLFALLAGCGAEELGVLRVEFALEPAPGAGDVAGVDTSGAAAWAGDVQADTVEGVGIVGAEGLPPIDSPYSYRATAGFAAGERDSLPGVEGEDEAGHAHGALSVPGRRAGVTTGFADVDLGALDWDATNGLWLLRFFADDAGHRPLGALRACVVVLVDDSGANAPAALLAGSVSPPEAEGHAH